MFVRDCCQLMKKMKHEWWKTFFDEHYLAFWRKRISNTKEEVDFIEKVIPLRKSYKILDLCCGHGRHSLELAKRGYRVTGLDYSAYELGLARKAAKAMGGKATFLRGDARHLRFKKQFDVVLNLFTSALGYGPETDSKKIIEGVSQALRKGGYLLLDTMNACYIVRNYKPTAKEKAGNLTRISKRIFDPLTFVNRETAVIKNKHGRIIKKTKTQARVFTYPEIRALLESVGLKPLKVFGSLIRKKFSVDSKRITVVAKKV